MKPRLHVEVIRDDAGAVIAAYPAEVMGGVMRDGVMYRWLVEPRPNRHDPRAWVEYIPPSREEVQPSHESLGDHFDCMGCSFCMPDPPDI